MADGDRDEIRSCPFCSGAAALKTDQFSSGAWMIWVVCRSCGATSKPEYSTSSSHEDMLEAEKKVIKSWDRRAE